MEARNHRLNRVARSRQAGIALLEVTLGIAGLVILSFVLLQLSIRSIQAQRWTVLQTLSDAYMSREVALGKRTSFEQIVADDSPWPPSPQASSQEVIIGRLPNGRPVTATLWRNRQADALNLPSAGGTGNSSSNPVGLETWKLQANLIYNVSDRPYVKTRTVIRTR